MLHELSKKVIACSVKRGFVKKEDFDQYVYGAELLSTILITDIAVLIIGLVFRMLTETLIFWILYKILRKYVGGFHFDSSIICFLSSCILCPAALIFIKYCPCKTGICFSVTAAALIIIFILSPVEVTQKPLDDDEIRVFGKIARILIILLFAIYLVCSFKFEYTAKIIAVSVWMVTLFAVMGKIKLMHRKQSQKLRQ
ncbi:MAG: accessory gene regulator B family protein [Clostridia bacterium]|nr:accessory gene regulator B family protein [Clostridia bacterium]